MEEVEGEPLFCERAAGIDIGKESVFVTIRVPSESRAGGRQQETREFGTTRRQLLALADWLRCWGVERAGMESTQRLLEAGVLPAGAGGLRVPAVPGVAGQGAARAAQDRQAGLGVAREDHRGGVAGGQLRAAGGDPPAAHPYPLPQAADPGPHRGEGARGEASGGRAPEAVVGDQRHPRGLRPGDAPRDHRRRAQPEGAGGDGPRGDAPQDRASGRGPGLLVLHPRARLHPADDAGQYRPGHRPDRRAGRADRRPVRALGAADRPAGRHPRASGSPPPRTSSPRSAST